MDSLLTIRIPRQDRENFLNYAQQQGTDMSELIRSFIASTVSAKDKTPSEVNR